MKRIHLAIIILFAVSQLSFAQTQGASRWYSVKDTVALFDTVAVSSFYFHFTGHIYSDDTLEVKYPNQNGWTIVLPYQLTPLPYSDKMFIKELWIKNYTVLNNPVAGYWGIPKYYITLWGR